MIDAFVNGLKMAMLGFERAEAAETGRPGYDPRDLLKLYLYGYLNQIRSSRRLEAECLRNVELMWLLGRLYPDHKSIAEFRRMHREAVTAAGVELVRFAKSCGLIRGEWIAIDGSKFRAVASIDSARERLDLQRYLDSMEKADEEQQASIDPSAVQAALEKLKQHPEPEVGFMLMGRHTLPAYNVQTAVDAEHSLIVAHTVVLDASDNRCLQPMAEAAKTGPRRRWLSHRRGRRVLQRRTGRRLRGSRDAALCARDAHSQQPGRWHLVRARGFPLRTRYRHLRLPRKQEAAT